MNRTIPLWSGTAPLFDESIGQSAPSLTMFPAENARGVVLVVPETEKSVRSAPPPWRAE